MIFNILKKVFIFNVILYHYNSNHKIVIETDVSDYMFESILFQYNEDEVLHSIIYFLKKHNSIKCNYKIYNKKLIIIIYIFKKWHLKLKSFTFSIEVITNHKNLKYFMFIKQFNHHQVYWSEFLFYFNYCITYCFDKIEGKSDALICWSDNFSKKENTSDSYYLYLSEC